MRGSAELDVKTVSSQLPSFPLDKVKIATTFSFLFLENLPCRGRTLLEPYSRRCHIAKRLSTRNFSQVVY
jgi:hypothetical protein